MAKEDMLCPFSKDLCQDCPQYRGRHYYLCYNSKYRGYLGKAEKETHPRSWSSPSDRFDIPAPLPISPKWLVLNQFIERKRK